MKFQIVYSLGLRCYTEQHLRLIDYRKCSSLFGSMNSKSFDVLKDMLSSNFETVLDPKNLIFTKDREDMKELNKQYGNRTLNRLYDDIDDYHTAAVAHHDLSLPEHVAHFRRGIDRLNAFKRHQVPILFVCITHFKSFNDTSINGVGGVADTLKELGWQNFHVLYIHFCRADDRKISKLYRDENKSIYTINYAGSYKQDGVNSPLVKQVLDEFDIDLLSHDEINALSEAPQPPSLCEAMTETEK